jgi:hypothetical protein
MSQESTGTTTTEGTVEDYEYSVPDQLNPEFIRDKLLEEFNLNKHEGENFTAVIEYKTSRSGKITFFVKISNNGVQCYKLDEPTMEDGKFIIHGGFNKKCSDIGKSGTRNLLNVISFAKKNGYNLFKLINVSALNFHEKSVELTMVKLLTDGDSWYSQFGFENPETIERKVDILPYINVSFRTFLDYINTEVDNYPILTPEKKSLIKQQILDRIETKIDFFKNDCELMTQTSLDTTISKYFKNLMNCIYEMYEKCKNYSSPLRPAFLSKIDAFNNFIGFMVTLIEGCVMIRNYEDYSLMSMLISDQNQAISLVTEKIESIYGYLSLDLETLQLVSGGKHKKTRGRKRHFTKKSRKNIRHSKKVKKSKKSKKSKRL